MSIRSGSLVLFGFIISGLLLSPFNSVITTRAEDAIIRCPEKGLVADVRAHLPAGIQVQVLSGYRYPFYLDANATSPILTMLPATSRIYLIDKPVCDAKGTWWRGVHQGVLGWIFEATRETGESGLEALSPRVDDVSFGGVSFQVDSRLMSSILGQVIPTYNHNNTSLPFWLKTPVFINFAINDLYDNPGTQAKIAVYPAQLLGDIQQTDQLELLRHQLNGQTTETRPPDLPITNAERVLYAQRQKLEFEGGSGVRMVVYYSDSDGVITNNSLRYVFQGMTAQGEHYVQIFLPLTTPLFPPQEQSEVDYARFVADYNSYLIEAEKTLHTATDADFYPPLSLLDTLISTLTIDSEGVSATLAGDMSLIARCELTALADTRLRIAPDVNAAVSDYLPANFPVAADAQFQRRGESFPWWRLAPNEVIVSLPSQNPLEGGRWIRADFTLESGNCAGLPLVIDP